jgi:hypothetical protein
MERSGCPAKTGQVPYRIELTCRKKSLPSIGTRQLGVRLARLNINSPPANEIIRGVTADSQIRDSLASWLTRRS